MNKIFYLIAIPLLLFACGGEEDGANTESDGEFSEVEGTDDQDLLASTNMDPRTFGGDKHDDQAFMDEMYPASEGSASDVIGSYVGDFGKNMINITIYEAKDGKAEGYSVCAGNFRKITGTYESPNAGRYNFVMEEPGDDKYDGTFEFELVPSEWMIDGTWTPFKAEGNSAKKYNLIKRVYSYDNSVGNYPVASQRELTDDDVNNLSEDELAEMRNEIYARHGYSFKNKDWRYYYEDMDWYMPMGVDIRSKLSDTEVVNIELIYEYESYFEEYYDDYGR